MTGIPTYLASLLAGRFRVERELGAGGMATVYLATDVRHDRKVALKVMRPGLASELGAERFLREIRISANLQHPHIVPLFDSGSVDGHLYFIMPYVEGESLRERLRRVGELPTDDALHILQEIADGLAYAHARGVIHRDLKPENILIAGRHVAIADFGVAKAVSEASSTDSHLTTQGVAIGTPAYMAPEQAMGESDVDHMADIYALGILAYEMLSGTVPFTGATAQQLAAAHLTRSPESLAQRRPTTAGAINNLVMRCLEKRPADRWQSAEDFLTELSGLLSRSARVAGGVPEPGVHDDVFPLTESVCRQLNRATLDPRIIGGEMHYLDNRRESPILVCFLHGVGGDQRQFEAVASVLPYRVLALTAYGFEPEARQQISLSLEDHLVLTRAFLTDAIARLGPSTVLVAGFSAGADVGLRLLASDPPLTGIDGYLSLSCNLSLDTCFASLALAKLADEKSELLSELQALGTSAATFEAWLLLHEYLVTTLRKFAGNSEVLRRYAIDIVRPFLEPGASPFVEWYRTVSTRLRSLRCVFEDGEATVAAIAALRLRHLDEGVLGDRHRHGSIVIVPSTNHFDLLEPGRIVSEIEALLASLDGA
jgi:serine/threonine protein kinase